MKCAQPGKQQGYCVYKDDFNGNMQKVDNMFDLKRESIHEPRNFQKGICDGFLLRLHTFGPKIV